MYMYIICSCIYRMFEQNKSIGKKIWHFSLVQ